MAATTWTKRLGEVDVRRSGITSVRALSAGEKRLFAHKTFSRFSSRVAFAAFDDSHPEFEKYTRPRPLGLHLSARSPRTTAGASHRFLSEKGEVWWATRKEPLYDRMVRRRAHDAVQHSFGDVQSRDPPPPYGRCG